MTDVIVYMEDGGDGTDPTSGTVGTGYDSFVDFDSNVVSDTGISNKNLTTGGGHSVICYVRDLCTVTAQQTLGNGWTLGDPRSSEPGDAETLWFVGMSGARALVDASPAGITTTSGIDLMVPYAAGGGNRFGFKWLRFEHAGTNTVGTHECLRHSTGNNHCYRYCHFDGGADGSHGYSISGLVSAHPLFQGCIFEDNGAHSTQNHNTWNHFTHCLINFRITDVSSTVLNIDSCLGVHEHDHDEGTDWYIHQSVPATGTLNIINSVFDDEHSDDASDANYVIDTDTNSVFAIDSKADGWFTDYANQDWTLTANVPTADRTRGAANTGTYILSEDALGNAIGATNSTPGPYQYVAAGGAAATTGRSFMNRPQIKHILTR